MTSETTSLLRDPALYANRELGQLDFNFRVLAQAQDPAVPLMERLRYLCISCTNLDEFFEIRGGAVRHAVEFGLPAGMDGLDPSLLLNRIHERAAELVDAQYRCFYDELRPALADAGIRLLQREQWNKTQRDWLRQYFNDEIMPVLSPLGLDTAHPFPKILNKSLNVVVLLEGKDAFGREGHLAIVRAPRSLPRIIRLPDRDGDGELEVVARSGERQSGGARIPQTQHGPEQEPAAPHHREVDQQRHREDAAAAPEETEHDANEQREKACDRERRHDQPANSSSAALSSRV